MTILSQLNSLWVRPSNSAVTSTMKNQHKWLSLWTPPHVYVLLLWGCAFLRDVSTCVRQYKPCRPTMLLWLSVYVRVGMRLCVHVWSSSPWQLYPAWHGPIKILLAASEGIARRAVHANAAATHTLYTASTGRYDSKHLQSSMKPRTAKEERGGLLMYG